MAAPGMETPNELMVVFSNTVTAGFDALSGSVKGIRMKPTTLARAYSTGSGGPPCRHIRNKPYYPLDLLERWAETQITAPAASSSERQRLRREARRREASA